MLLLQCVLPQMVGCRLFTAYRCGSWLQTANIHTTCWSDVRYKDGTGFKGPQRGPIRQPPKSMQKFSDKFLDDNSVRHIIQLAQRATNHYMEEYDEIEKKRLGTGKRIPETIKSLKLGELRATEEEKNNDAKFLEKVDREFSKVVEDDTLQLRELYRKPRGTDKVIPSGRADDDEYFSRDLRKVNKDHESRYMASRRGREFRRPQKGEKEIQSIGQGFLDFVAEVEKMMESMDAEPESDDPVLSKASKDINHNVDDKMPSRNNHMKGKQRGVRSGATDEKLSNVKKRIFGEQVPVMAPRRRQMGNKQKIEMNDFKFDQRRDYRNDLFDRRRDDRKDFDRRRDDRKDFDRRRDDRKDFDRRRDDRKDFDRRRDDRNDSFDRRRDDRKDFDRRRDDRNDFDRRRVDRKDFDRRKVDRNDSFDRRRDDQNDSFDRRSVDRNDSFDRRRNDRNDFSNPRKYDKNYGSDKNQLHAHGSHSRRHQSSKSRDKYYFGNSRTSEENEMSDDDDVSGDDDDYDHRRGWNASRRERNDRRTTPSDRGKDDDQNGFIDHTIVLNHSRHQRYNFSDRMTGDWNDSSRHHGGVHQNDRSDSISHRPDQDDVVDRESSLHNSPDRNKDQSDAVNRRGSWHNSSDRSWDQYDIDSRRNEPKSDFNDYNRRTDRTGFGEETRYNQNTINHQERTFSGPHLWRIPKGIHSRLQELIFRKPKFIGQIYIPLNIQSIVGTDEKVCRVDKRKIYHDLDRISVVGDLHSLIKSVIEEMVNDGERIEALRTIQNECCQRINTWSITEILYAMDLFYSGRFFALTFHKVASKLIDLKMGELRMKQKDVVQFLFFLCLFREVPITLMPQLEGVITADFDQYTPPEVELVCSAFFLTNSCIVTQRLIESIVTTLQKQNKINQDKFHTILGSCLKVIRQSHYTYNRAFLDEMGDSVIKESSPKNKFDLLQVCKTYSSFLYHHPRFYSRFFSLWNEENIESLRFKDLVDVMWSSAVLQMKPPDVLLSGILRFYDGDLRQLRRINPRKYIEGLVSLVLMDIYPLKAIDYALALQLEDTTRDDGYEQLFQHQLLDETVGMMCPDYNGTRLPENWFMRAEHQLRQQLQWRRGIAVLLSTLQRLLGNPDLVSVGTIIKYSSIPDVIIYVDENNAPVSVSGDGRSDLVSPYDPAELDDITSSIRVDVDDIVLTTGWANGSGEPQFDAGGAENGSIIHSLLADNFRRNLGCLHMKPTPRCEKYRRLAVKVLGWNQYLLNKDQIHGLHLHTLNMMVEQGYEVIGISPPHAHNLEAMSQEQRDDFVQTEIFDRFGIKI